MMLFCLKKLNELAMQTVGFKAAASPHDHDIAFLQAYSEEAAFTGEQNILDSFYENFGIFYGNWHVHF